MRLIPAIMTLALSAALSGAALGLDAAAPPPPPGGAPASAVAPKPSFAAAPAPVAAPTPQGAAVTMPETATGKKAKSEDCYRQADSKNLHGKERKHFHNECMRG